MNTNIPVPSSLPSIMKDNYKKYSMKDVIRAITIISSFLRYKEKIDNIINYFSACGITLDFSVFSNPNLLMKQLLSLKSRNSNVDINEIINELNSLDDIKLDEIDEAINIIRSFISLSRNVSSIISILSKSTTTGIREIELLKGLFSIPQQQKAYEEEEVYDNAKIDKIREEVRKILKEG